MPDSDDEVSVFEQCCEKIARTVNDPEYLILWPTPRPMDVVPHQVAIMPTKFKCYPGGSSDAVLFTEELVVEVHFHADTLSQASALRIRVANAIAAVMKSNAVPLDGVYDMDWPPAPDKISEYPYTWVSNFALVQRYVWKFEYPRYPQPYAAKVREIAVVDNTQITTTVDGALTPSEQLDIK